MMLLSKDVVRKLIYEFVREMKEIEERVNNWEGC
jgi:hypothetical protein